MLMKIVILIVLVVGLFLAYVAFLPNEMQVSREIIINSSSETLFPYINS